MLRRILFAAALSLVVATMTASADPIMFTNQAAFVSQTGATSQPLPLNLATTVLTAGSLTFTLGPGAGAFHSGDSQYGTPLSGNNLLISGVESFITMTAPVFAFGFSMYEPTSSALLNGCNTTCVDSTFVVTLFSGSTAIGSFTISPQDNTVLFFGFWSSTAFDRISVLETVGTNDNEYFGNFYAGGRALNPVPEPATLLLLGTGLAGIALKRLRQS